MELEPLDDYPGGPHDLYVLTMYYVSVIKRMFDGVVRFHNLYFFVLCF